MGAMSPWHFLVLSALLLGAVGTITWVVVLLVRSSGSNTQQLAPTFPQAGWYPDAQGPAILRYFDGNLWTPHTRPRT